MIAVLILCGFLVVRLCEKYGIPLFVRRIFPYTNEYVAKKWIDRELSNGSVPLHRPYVKLTDDAVEFIKAKSPKELALQISDSYRIGYRIGALPSAKIRLGVADPSENFVRLISSAGIAVVVTRTICDVLKKENISLIVTTSGFWRFKKLELRPDLSWLLYKEKMRAASRFK